MNNKSTTMMMNLGNHLTKRIVCSTATTTHGNVLILYRTNHHRNDRIIMKMMSSISSFSATNSPITRTRTISNEAGIGDHMNHHHYQVLPILPKPSVDNIPQPISSSTIDESNRWWYEKLYHRYSIKEQQYRIYRAEELFQAASRQASNPIWYGPGQIGRDFRSRHAILTMHIWLLHKRLIADKVSEDTALSIQEELFHILWDDTTCRIRAQPNVNELSVNKLLLQVQQYTFHHLTHYDHAYTEYLDKPIQRLKELRLIIFQHIFLRNPILEHRYDHIDRLAWYIDCNYCNIMLHWPYQCYQESRVAWTTMPHFDNILDSDGHTIIPHQSIHPDDIIPEPWIQNITLRGIPYYWNPVTRQSSWEKPITANTNSEVASNDDNNNTTKFPPPPATNEQKTY